MSVILSEARSAVSKDAVRGAVHPSRLATLAPQDDGLDKADAKDLIR